MLCSHIAAQGDIRPLEPSEWSQLADKLLKADMQPDELPDMSDSDYSGLGIDPTQTERIRRLLGRGANLALEAERYRNMGIDIVTPNIRKA